MTMDTLEDGSLIFSEPFNYTSATYYQDPDNPCRYIPKFEPCAYRKLELRVLSCGKKIPNWQCSQLGTGISVRTCRECKLPKELPSV